MWNQGWWVKKLFHVWDVASVLDLRHYVVANTQLCVFIETSGEAVEKMNSCLVSVVGWMSTNKMKINTEAPSVDGSRVWETKVQFGLIFDRILPSKWFFTHSFWQQGKNQYIFICRKKCLILLDCFSSLEYEQMVLSFSRPQMLFFALKFLRSGLFKIFRGLLLSDNGCLLKPA